MQRETSNDSFLDYGSVYHQPIDHEHPAALTGRRRESSGMRKREQMRKALWSGIW